MKAARAATTNAIEPMKRLIAVVPVPFGGCVTEITATRSLDAISLTGSSTPRTAALTWNQPRAEIAADRIDVYQAHVAYLCDLRF